MTIEEIYEDFKQLKGFNAQLEIKKKMLKELLEATERPWNIIGITPDALQLLGTNDFYMKSKMTNKNLAIQRAHLNDRHNWYGELFKRDFFSAKEWYDFIQQNDKTVLGLSTENKRITEIEFIPITNSILFRSTRISWKHGNVERQFLRDLHEKHFE